MFAITIALLVYLVVKAIYTPMTHDEACTYFYFTEQNNFKCFFDPLCWPYANNHLLNTISIQFFVSVLGVSNLSIRLPNILSFLLYSGYAIAFSSFLFTNKSIRILLFVSLVLNPFMLDFFMLARGYGMANAFMLPGVYYAIRFLDERKTKYIFVSFLFLAFSVISNFVWVLAWVAVWAALIIIDIVRAIKEEKYSFTNHIYIFVLSILLGTLCYIPIKTLSQKAEFKFGVRSIGESMKSFISNSVYGINYFGSSTVDIFHFTYWLLFFGAIGLSIFALIKKTKNAERALFFGVILAAVFVFQIAQYYLLGVFYIDARKTIIYHPLSVLFFINSFGLLQFIFPKVKALYSVIYIVLIIVIIHFWKGAKIDSVREWWYDKNTNEVLRDIEAFKDEYSTPIRVGVKWIFWPSFSFYQRTDSLNYMEEIKFNTSIDTSAYFDYYYIQSDEFPLLGDKYELYKNYGEGMLVKKKK